MLSGKAPIKVNATAGTATNLSADKLDGKDSTEFLGSYKRTVVVSPVGTDTENGTALLNALAGITDASATKKYLVHIEPGTYDLGTRTLQMKQYVDIQGSGELNTVITSAATSEPTDPIYGCGFIAAVVATANNAELRFLTVQNTGAGSGCSGAIKSSVDSAPRLTQLTAKTTASGGAPTTAYLSAVVVALL